MPWQLIVHFLSTLWPIVHIPARLTYQHQSQVNLKGKGNILRRCKSPVEPRGTEHHPKRQGDQGFSMLVLAGRWGSQSQVLDLENRSSTTRSTMDVGHGCEAFSGLTDDFISR
ncbi:hypothetical protein B0T19DRAFT_410442 [Cercophora scortea]|uniref:Secreted protein n=1 Tax=Cercophora scortea TaxID=314031 RepID=A0AAE0J4H7_9PEZI|nr:hypothetical protein B0T19DRAFT_410442 [Cercophora scortea]